LPKTSRGFGRGLLSVMKPWCVLSFSKLLACISINV
jgi:hypothetical protein